MSGLGELAFQEIACLHCNAHRKYIFVCVTLSMYCLEFTLNFWPIYDVKYAQRVTLIRLGSGVASKGSIP